MRLQVPQQIDKMQWLRRLGYSDEATEQCLADRGADGNVHAELVQQMEEAERKLIGAASPQGTFEILGLEEFCFSETPHECGLLELPGNSIKKHLDGCRQIALLAVTLGAGVDRLIRTAQVRDMAEAVILDAGASIMIEQMADLLQREIMAEFQTMRYSPGYGDFPLEMQKQLLKALDGPRKIGLTSNESHILIPRKSITAIVGIADHPVKGYLATCEECSIREGCRLRAEGKTCNFK